MSIFFIRFAQLAKWFTAICNKRNHRNMTCAMGFSYKRAGGGGWLPTKIASLFRFFLAARGAPGRERINVSGKFGQRYGAC